jgi:hypothetical protein
VEKRKELMMRYNRVLFLLQGLLDRSDLFHPHPPIDLSNPEHLGEFFIAKLDEEEGLPTANPPDVRAYIKELNAKLKPGMYAWGTWEEEYGNGPSWERKDRKVRRICEVTQIRKNRSEVRLSWPWGTVWGYRKTERHWYGRGEWGEWEVNRQRHQWVPMEKIFNVSDYKPGDYKQFLCDARLIENYIEWAPQLLAAEKWHLEQKQKSEESKEKD